MELRAYGRILLRRWPIVAIPALIVLIVGLATYRPPAPSYSVGVRFLIGQPPAAAAPGPGEDSYYNWLASEYIVNAFTDWVKGNEFSEEVSAELAGRGIELAPGTIQGGLAADNARSMFTLSLVHSDPDLLIEMMDAAIVVLQQHNTAALPQLGQRPAVLVPLDDPVVNPLPAGLRMQLELPLRIALALIAGVGLALLVEYLDSTVHESDEVEALGLTILGEIPEK